MFNKLRKIAVAGLAAAAVITGISGCAPATTGSDGSNLSTSMQPVPLAEHVDVKISMALKIEQFTPLLLTEALGEFEKENISVEFVFLPQTDALTALAQGQIDASMAGVTAAYFNAVDGGADLRLVMPGAANSDKDGLYIRSDLVDGAPASLKGTTLAASQGYAALYAAILKDYFAQGELTLEDVTLETLPQADIASAIDAGLVDGGWVVSPAHVPLVENNVAQRVANYAADQSGTALVFGPNLHDANPEVGQAIVRAITRVIHEHLQGDYKQNSETVAAIAEALEVTPDDVASTDSLNFGLNFNTEFYTAAQKVWMSIDGIFTADHVMEPSEYLDASFFDRIERE